MKPFLRSVMIALGLGIMSVPVSQAANGDCNSNSVIYCGVDNQTDVVRATQAGDTKHSGADITQIYLANGVQIGLITSTVNGTVTKDGRVLLADGRVVATGAQSVGRDNLPGSTKQGNVYIRSTAVSFRQASLPAFISMQNNQFAWAIITSCGNPVVATPVIVQTSGTTPTPTPVYSPPPPTPAPTPVATPTPATPSPTPLPQSGPVDILGGAVGLTFIVLAKRLHTNSRAHLKRALLRMR